MFNRLKSGKYIILVLVMVLALGITGCTTNEAAKNDEVVAKIGDVEITKDEFYDSLVEQYGEESLNAMISDKIIEMEVKKANIEITQEDIDEEYGKMEDYYGGPEVLEQTMAQYNMSKEDMQENIKLNLAMKRLVAEDVEVTDAEIEEFYAENAETFNQEEQVNASHILAQQLMVVI